MKKIYGLLAFGMLAFVLLFSMASAAITVTNPTQNLADLPQTYNATGYTFEINVSSNESETITLSIVDIEQDGEYVRFNVIPNPITFLTTPLGSVNSSIVTIQVYVTDGFEFDLGKIYNTTLIAEGTKSLSVTEDLIFKETLDFCKNKDKGDLLIDDFRIDNLGAGSDDTWEMFDEIEIKVEVENEDEDERLNDVQLEIKILEDETGKDVTSDFIEDDNEIDMGRIYEDDSEIELFNLKVTSDVKEGDYRIYIKAYEQGDEAIQCADDLDDEDYYLFEVKTDEEFKIDELTIDETIGCGETQLVYFDLYNFGLGDNEKMRVNLYNAELGIDLYSEDFEIDEDKKEDISFEITIPEDIEEKTYKLKVYVEYNYKDSSERFDKISEDTEEFSIIVEGNCRIEAPLVDVSQLDEDVVVKSGDTVEIELTLANQEDDEVMFVLTAEDYSSWANSVKISESLVTLVEGGATVVKYTLTLKDDLETKDYSFNMVVSSGGKELVIQPVAVTVEARKGLSDLFDEVNWKLVGIILVNLALLIAIILVVRKILKRR